MKTFLEKIVVVSCITLCSLFSLNATAEIKVIVHSSVHADASASDIADIFLGTTNSLPGGTKVTPVDQADDTQAEFYKKIANKDAAQLKAYWSRLIFTGKGQPPRRLGTDTEVIRYVATNPDSIGYVSGNAQLKGVNVLFTVP